MQKKRAVHLICIWQPSSGLLSSWPRWPVFREAEDFMIASLFAEHPLSDEHVFVLSGKQDAAIIAINGLSALAGTAKITN
jgi:hypothetical protein